MSYNFGKLKVDFSLRREVFFVVLGALLGGAIMMLPELLSVFSIGNGVNTTIWIIFGHVIGVYSEHTILAGILIHFLTASSIGIVLGLFLYKTGILEINKPVNGLLYGLFTGTVVFLLWAIPIQYLVLNPESARTVASMNPSLTLHQIQQSVENNQLTLLFQTLARNLTFGVTLGLVSSLLSIKLGKRYLCPKCQISFARVDMVKRHLRKIHYESLATRKVVVLGGGFGGIETLKILQKSFENDIRVDITLVNSENFFLFTPMLHEVVSGTIETSNIAVSLRSFCKRARFVEADVVDIDTQRRKVKLRNNIFIGKGTGREQETYRHFDMDYDYLVVALGGETNFYNSTRIEQSSFSMKNLYDANSLRSHLITTLEQADILDNDDPAEYKRKKNLLTYIVVGGGFSGVETVGEINAFVRECVKLYYHNIDSKDLRIVLVSSTEKILPEMEVKLGEFAIEELRKNGVQTISSKKVKDIVNSRINYRKTDKTPLGYLASNYTDISSNIAILDDDTQISTYTIVWTAGIIPQKAIQNIDCPHDRKGKIITNDYLQIEGFRNIFAVGDCANITDPGTGNPCPPTAQHALRQGEIAGRNLVSIIKYDLAKKESEMIRFNYRARGTMATVGKRKGVAIIFGTMILGTIAWMMWRGFYLSKMPSRAKRFRVMIDWTVDLMFRDVSRLKTPAELIPSKITEKENQ